jgi:type I restriction enzyme S subunit
MTNYKNVPVLRFKEFEREWNNKKFKEVSTFYNGKSFKQVELLDNGKYTVLRVGNLFTNKNWYFSDLELDENKYIEYNDLIYAWSASFGPRIWKGEKVIYHYHIWKVVCDLNKINKIFYFQVLDNETAKMKETSTNGFALLHITKGVIENWKSCFPTKPEQQKIANFLTATDTKIQQLRQKKGLLNDYKKGVMQQIFKQEIRFKNDDGGDFEDWEVKKLGEVCIKKSSNISANTLVENEGEFKIYGAAGLLKKINSYQEEKAFIGIVKDGAGVGRIRRCEPKSSVLGTLDIIKPQKNVNTDFLFSLLERINFVKYIVGSTIPHIYFRDYKNQKLKLPSLPEQQKIANFLTSIDERIGKVSEEIGEMERYKKGLLQGMFV